MRLDLRSMRESVFQDEKTDRCETFSHYSPPDAKRVLCREVIYCEIRMPALN